MLILSAYTAFLLLLGYFDFRKKEGLNGFLIANRKASAKQVAFSMIATCVGGTATIGVAGNVMNKGFPAIWWLLSGALGLLILSIFLTKIIYRTGAMTLPEIAQHFISKPARKMSAVVISIAWCAILAAQFSACANIISVFGISFNHALICSALVIILYTALGGQASVIKSDVYQYLLVILAFVGVLIWLLSTQPDSIKQIPIELVNDRFTYQDIAYYLLFIGTSYIIDPMLFSRVLSAKDEKTAFIGSIWGAIGIAISGIVIVCVGFGALSLLHHTQIASDQLLTQGLIPQLPPILGVILLLGLLSAIISSADTCLITASSVFAHDIVGTRKVSRHRTMTWIFGGIAFYLAAQGGSILNYLLAANDLFVGGVAIPLFFAMIFKGKINKQLLLFAMLCGGGLGLVSALGSLLDAGGYWDSKQYSIYGIVLSVLLSISAYGLYQMQNKFCRK